MKELIVVIATKNRNELLNEALRSVCLQTKKPDEVVVVSDSIEETKKADRKSSIKCGFTFLEDKYTHNYAGNLNTAIDYIVKTRLIGSKKGSTMFIWLFLMTMINGIRIISRNAPRPLGMAPTLSSVAFITKQMKRNFRSQSLKL